VCARGSGGASLPPERVSWEQRIVRRALGATLYSGVLMCCGSYNAIFRCALTPTCVSPFHVTIRLFCVCAYRTCVNQDLCACGRRERCSDRMPLLLLRAYYPPLLVEAGLDQPTQSVVECMLPILELDLLVGTPAQIVERCSCVFLRKP